MWNCHSWPLDVSNNISGDCISNLVLVSTFGIYMCIYALVIPYIFLLVDCFEWALIGDIEQERFHSVLWQFWMGVSIISFTWVKLTFPYIFLLIDCFKWALIGHIEQQRVCSVLWQFQMGGLSVLPPRGKSENLSSNEFYALLHRRSFRITYERPNEHFPIYLLGNTINVCWNCQNRVCFLWDDQFEGSHA